MATNPIRPISRSIRRLSGELHKRKWHRNFNTLCCITHHKCVFQSCELVAPMCALAGPLWLLDMSSVRGTCLQRKINICTMCAALMEVSECQVHVDRVSKPKLLCVCGGSNVFSTCNETRSPVREMYFHHCRGVIDWVQNLVSALCRQEIDLREAMLLFES